MNDKDFLNLGSVVLLKNGKKPLMVIGYAYPTLDNDNLVYDYLGALYPEGILATDNNILFNHEDIDKVLFIGYESDLGKEFKNKLMNIYQTTEIKKAKKEYEQAVASLETLDN